MNDVALHALRPSHPLGFLAALGAQRVLANSEIPARLSWSDESTPHAILHAGVDRGTVLDALAATWQRQAERRAVFTFEFRGEIRAFPPREPLAEPEARRGKRGMNDPVKMLACEYRTMGEAVLACGEADAAAWLRAVASDTVLDRSNEPAIATLSPLYLLSRQQRLVQQFEAVWDHLKHESAMGALEAALTSWRRTPMKGGMNWDIGGNSNAAESATGTASTAVAPGATWLAMMAMPYFPVTGRSNRLVARSLPLVAEGVANRHMLVMPAWRLPLDVAAVETLLDHPLLGIEHATGHLRGGSTALSRLGVTVVYGSRVVSRRVANQNEYYLGEAAPLMSTSA